MVNNSISVESFSAFDKFYTESKAFFTSQNITPLPSSPGEFNSQLQPLHSRIITAYHNRMRYFTSVLDATYEHVSTLRDTDKNSKTTINHAFHHIHEHHQ